MHSVIEGRRGETHRAGRQISFAAIARERICQSDHGSCMQKSVGGHDRFVDLKFASDFRFTDVRNDDAEMAGQLADADLIEMFKAEHY
jgi:hypothetical protein